MRITIIIHTSNEAALETLRDHIARLRDEGHEISPRLTFEAGDAAWMAKEGCRRGCDLLIAAGGDGTVNETVNGLHSWLTAGETAAREVPRLAILPLGTANDLAGMLGIPPEVDAALQVALRGRDQPFDVGVVEGRCFINVSTGGFGAEASDETPEDAKRALGPLAYLITGVRKFASLEPLTARISSQGQRVAEGRFMLFVVGNGRRTGGGNFLTPNADPSDGLLDLLLVEEMTRVEFLRLLPQLRAGEHLDHPRVIYRQLPELLVEADEQLSVNVDGEPLSGRRFRYSVSEHQVLLRV